jgi:hypothetical protein
MTIFKTMLVAAIAVCALVLATGCQPKGPAGKNQESVSKRAEESNKIIEQAQKRVHDSLAQAKKDAEKK